MILVMPASRRLFAVDSAFEFVAASFSWALSKLLLNL